MPTESTPSADDDGATPGEDDASDDQDDAAGSDAVGDGSADAEEDSAEATDDDAGTGATEDSDADAGYDASDADGGQGSGRADVRISGDQKMHVSTSLVVCTRVDGQLKSFAAPVETETLNTATVDSISGMYLGPALKWSIIASYPDDAGSGLAGNSDPGVTVSGEDQKHPTVTLKDVALVEVTDDGRTLHDVANGSVVCGTVQDA